MILKLDFAIKDRPWFPASERRRFTEFEARIDYLMQKGSGIELTPLELADRWKWNLDNVSELLGHMQATTFLEGDWYIEDNSAATSKARASEIIDIFREVTGRKVQLNDHRIRLINGRIKEGKKFKNKVGPAQFRAVFEFKKKEWTGTEQEKYLTLETLCAPKHFFNYLEAAREDYKKKKAEKDEGTVLPGKLFKQ
jgi:uncharacterized phage protein (TIGR02220 family)